MKDDKITNLEPEQKQEIELTEDELDEVAGGAFGLAAGDKDFVKKGLVFNETGRAANPAELLPAVRNNSNRA